MAAPRQEAAIAAANSAEKQRKYGATEGPAEKCLFLSSLRDQSEDGERKKTSLLRDETAVGERVLQPTVLGFPIPVLLSIR